jgi:hypothetical protein
MNDEHLVRFTFDLIDEDRSGYLSREEVYDLILLMSKTEAEAQLKCQKLLNVIDANRDGDVSYVEFARCHRRIPSLMQPAFIIRRSLRMKCMGFTRRGNQPVTSSRQSRRVDVAHVTASARWRGG